MIDRPYLLSALIAATALLSTSCAVAPPVTPQETQIQEDLAVDRFLPATRAMRDAIETQELFAQAAFWSNEYTLNPSDLEAALKLAAAVRKLGNPGRAVEITQHTRALYPKDPYLLAEYGAALLASERSLDAIPILDSGLSAAPGYGRLWSLKGAALDQQERYAEARQHYDRALRITPNDPNVMANVGLSHALSGDLATAEGWLRRASSLPNASDSVRQNLILVLQLQGKADESQKLAGLIRPQANFPQTRRTQNRTAALRPSAAQPTRNQPVQNQPLLKQPLLKQPLLNQGVQNQAALNARLQTGPTSGQHFSSASEAARAIAAQRSAQGAPQQAPTGAYGQQPTQANVQTSANAAKQGQAQGYYPAPNYGQPTGPAPSYAQPQRREPSRRRR